MKAFIITVLAFTLIEVIGRLIMLSKDELPPRTKREVALDTFLGVVFLLWGAVVLLVK